MRHLARHYSRCRRASPDDRLLVVFDIDGTILDMRHMVHHVLTAYDRAHGTNLFSDLRYEDIDVHENQVDRFLVQRIADPSTRLDVHRWYLATRWEPAAVLEAHRPYQGVMEVIRWFQLQPSTYIGLNTGRPESLRAETLRSLNSLGREYRVSFSDELLVMNPGGWADDVTEPKARGLNAFTDRGYRLVAVVDNEPENIAAMAEADTSGDTLFLHAQTLYETQRVPTPRTVEGQSYELRSLIDERDLPQHVRFVWHGVNDPANMRQFLPSPVRWGEVDVRCNPSGELLLQHDPPEATAIPLHERLSLTHCLDAFRRAGKGIKLDIKDPAAVDAVLAEVRRSGMSDDDLWFNGRVDLLGEDQIRRIADAHPNAVLQCPIDFLSPLAVAAPAHAKILIELFVSWGIDRFSVSWANGQLQALIDRLDEWGYETNIYAVPDLEQFLRAVLLLPTSITADFNFPEWHYFGRGSGQNGHYHSYRIDAPAHASTDVA